MTLDDLLEIIEKTTPEDWYLTKENPIARWHYGTLKGANFLEPICHFKLLVLKSDIDISIAFGAPITDPFEEPWAKKFLDSHAVLIAIHLRYRGALVYDWPGVYVDGSRYLVPLPEREKLSDGFMIPRWRLKLARVLFALDECEGVYETVEQVLEKAGVRIA